MVLNDLYGTVGSPLRFLMRLTDNGTPAYGQDSKCQFRLCYWQIAWPDYILPVPPTPPQFGPWLDRTIHDAPHSYPWLPGLPQRDLCGDSERTNGSRKIFPNGEFFQFEGHAAFILRPDASVEVPPTNKPWVFYAPTLAAYPDTHEEWMHRKLLSAGIAIAGLDMGEAYGNPESRQAFDRFLRRTHRTSTDVKEALFAWTQSGWAVGEQLACDHPERFAGIAGIYRCTICAVIRGWQKAAPAYGLSEAELTKRLDEFNPIARAVCSPSSPADLHHSW